ncbi:MAG: hypothetical protein ACI87E_002939, partial [Mariniblastus sp.]
ANLLDGQPGKQRHQHDRIDFGSHSERQYNRSSYRDE